MMQSPEQSPLVDSKSLEVAYQLALLGILITLLGNAIDVHIYKIDIGETLSHVGALLLIVGVLQWFFDRHVRAAFFKEIRSEIIGNSHTASSGICDFYANSKQVDFSEYFTSSTELIIGVNYSGKLIDNCIELLKDRTKKKFKTTIIVVKLESLAERFLAHDYSTPDIPAGLRKIREMVSDLDPNGSYIDIVAVDTVLRYSFVKFDSRIWVVIATNGLGRRSVPGFFVSNNTPWFDHFKEDIQLLLKRT